MVLFFSLILLLFALAFAWCVFGGWQTGRTYIPAILLRDEEYERGQPGFELAMFANFAGMTASAAAALRIGFGSL